MKLPRNEFAVLLILFALIAIAGAAVLFYPKTQPGTPSPIKIEEQEQKEKDEENTLPESIEEELSTQRTLNADLYSIIIPEGWVQAVIDSDKFLALVIKPDGPVDIVDPANIDYDTYYAINNTKMETNSLDEYVDVLKQNLVKQINSIEFTRQSYGAINGHDAIYLESTSSIGGEDYSTLLTFVLDEKWVWAISFNTLKDDWGENKSTFYRVSDSLIIK
ncbi:MAG: hypothetical protein HYT21_02290 [Candidatus Nealsonbacteria bacterium]|nr:hypothetical protein [Candidatus Nealsonbacteria bacterium]